MVNPGTPWHKLAVNPEPIDKIYGRELSLSGSEVSKLSLDWGGPTLDVRFHVREMPEIMPAKWIRDGVNAVAVDLRFGSLKEIKISQWGTHNKIQVQWKLEGSHHMQVSLLGDETKVTATFEFLLIAGIHGYAVANPS